MGHAILVLLRSRLSREQRGEFAVKVDQVLRVLPSFELILRFILRKNCMPRLEGWLTSFSSEMSAHPRRTWVSFQTFGWRQPSGIDEIQPCLLTEIMGIVHASVHTLSSFGGMRVASVTSDKNAFVDGKLRRDPLANCFEWLENLQLWRNKRHTNVNRPPLNLSGIDCVRFEDLLNRLRARNETFNHWGRCTQAGRGRYLQ